MRWPGKLDDIWVAKYEPRTTEKPYTMTWLICRTDYYPTEKRAGDALAGKTEVPKGKRKPRPIEAMTEAEVMAWLGVGEK